MQTFAVLLAGGNSSRMQNEKNKMLIQIAQKSVLRRSLETLLLCEKISKIFIVAGKSTFEHAKELSENLGSRCQIVLGGDSRAKSVYNGLCAIENENQQCEVVVIHDGARCLVSKQIIENSIEIAAQKGSAIAAVRSKDTLKRVNEKMQIIGDIGRESVWNVQTPQSFCFRKILNAYKELFEQNEPLEGVTDDACVLERFGEKAFVFNASYANIKITTSEDLAFAEGFLKTPTNQKPKIPNILVGFGEDTHATILKTKNPLAKLVLGGIEIDCEFGLVGHSDADVVSHAISDALLGACALGDIGQHFPDTQAQYKNADSVELLKKVYHLVLEKSYIISNVDVTISAQKPKIAPYVDAIRENLATALNCEKNYISIKATTTEHLGFVGRCEGINARCTLLLTKIE